MLKILSARYLSAKFLFYFQKTMITLTAAASVTDQIVVVEEPLAAPTKELVSFGNLNESVFVDTVDMGVKEEHVVQNSEVHIDRIIRHVGAPVEGTVNDQLFWGKQ